MDLVTLKIRIHEQCMRIALEKMQSLTTDIEAIQWSANQESKSSAGDKYETGRSILMLEKEKLTEQLMGVGKLKKALDLIDVNKLAVSAELGALIQSSSQYYYLSANFGLLTIDGHDVFALSALSPIGQAMLGKTVGDTCDFRDQKFSIQKIA